MRQTTAVRRQVGNPDGRASGDGAAAGAPHHSRKPTGSSRSLFNLGAITALILLALAIGRFLVSQTTETGALSPRNQVANDREKHPTASLSEQTNKPLRQADLQMQYRTSEAVAMASAKATNGVAKHTVAPDYLLQGVATEWGTVSSMNLITGEDVKQFTLIVRGQDVHPVIALDGDTDKTISLDRIFDERGTQIYIPANRYSIRDQKDVVMLLLPVPESTSFRLGGIIEPVGDGFVIGAPPSHFPTVFPGAKLLRKDPTSDPMS